MTKIEWTEQTWNPLAGCTAKSPGCLNCYAATMAPRLAAMGQTKYIDITRKKGARQIFTGKISYDENALLAPLRWKKPRMVFVNSMSDLFWGDEEDLETSRRMGVIDPKPVPYEFIDRVLSVIAATPQNTYQLLTKRPGRALEYFKHLQDAADQHAPTTVDGKYTPAQVLNIRMLNHGVFAGGYLGKAFDAPWPLPNLWLGVSCEDQTTANTRIPLLLNTPAAIRWLSIEPLLAPVDIRDALPCRFCRGRGWYLERLTHDYKTACQNCINNARARGIPIFPGQMAVQAGSVNWVIVGGESGNHARPCDIAWIRSIVKQCESADVPVFVKQLGRVPTMSEKEWRDAPVARLLSAVNAKRVPDGFVGIAMSDKKGGELSDFPADLQIRKYPEVSL